MLIEIVSINKDGAYVGKEITSALPEITYGQTINVVNVLDNDVEVGLRCHAIRLATSDADGSIVFYAVISE